MAINKVILSGRVTEPGPKLTYTSEGTPQSTFTLLLEEVGKDGATFKVFVPVDVFGKHAEAVIATVEVGDVVLLDGKLRWKSWVDKRGDKKGKLAVLAWQVDRIETPAASRPAMAEAPG